jgi:hypothetical protein
MANAEHLEILKQGWDVWNQWRREHPKTQPDLSEADLSEADLRPSIVNPSILGYHFGTVLILSC